MSYFAIGRDGKPVAIIVKRTLAWDCVWIVRGKVLMRIDGPRSAWDSGRMIVEREA